MEIMSCMSSRVPGVTFWMMSLYPLWWMAPQNVVTVTKYNTVQKGTITVHKEGEVFSHVTEAGGLYQPQYEVQGQPGRCLRHHRSGGYRHPRTALFTQRPENWWLP